MQDMEEHYDHNPVTVAQKFDDLISNIREENCYFCGTQAPACGCPYDSIVKLIEKAKAIYEHEHNNGR